MTYTIATLDFEASSLDEYGFPIEVTCVLGNAQGIFAQFNTLIRPMEHWPITKGWSQASAHVHGISINQINEGMSVARVCTLLNGMLSGLAVTVDGGTFDQFWFDRLYEGHKAEFELDHLDGVDVAAFRAAKALVPMEHRALPDALWLWHTLKRLRASAAFSNMPN